jgi:phosphate transport system permease protein
VFVTQISGLAGGQAGRPPSLAARGRNLIGDRTFKYLSLVAALLVLAILLLILITTLKQAWPAYRLMGWRIITDPTWQPNQPTGPGQAAQEFGGLSAIFGTAYVAVIALVIAVPVSIAIGLFITELAPRRLRGAAVTIVDLLAAIPSVVFGLWGILVFTQWASPIYDRIHSFLGPVPVLGGMFGENKLGRNFLSAGIIVAIMITPIITSITREVFATVPSDHKQAALALGATRWEMIKGSVLPHSFGGVVGAVMLGLGRAMGETIAVALVVGGDFQIKPNLFAAGYTIPSLIANQFGEANQIWTAALIGLGVILFVITIVVNYAARFVVRRAEIRMRGAAA